MTVSLAAQAGSSVCCVCRREIIGVPNTSWGGKNAHRHCATRAFQTSHRQRPTLTEEQQRAAEAIEAAIEARKHFNLDGVAGTGKTIVLANVASRHEDAYLCAPTAKAASVVTMKTGITATAVHAVFYRLIEEIEQQDRQPRLVFGTVKEPGSLRGEVLLLDESSMVNKTMAADIMRIGITVGDPGQLPPVEGVPFLTEASFTLTQIHRQALENPIVRQAYAVRVGGQYKADGDAVRVINQLKSDDLRAAEVVLTGRRHTRMRMNAEKRRVLDLSNPLPRIGEPLICLRNTPRYGLCNGAIYYASRDLEENDQTIGISTDEGDIEVPAIFLTPGHEYDRPEVPPGRWMSVFSFGYALTVHQAQGSEFDNVLLIDEWFHENRNRRLYTGLTRAKERIVIARKGEQL